MRSCSTANTSSKQLVLGYCFDADRRCSGADGCKHSEETTKSCLRTTAPAGICSSCIVRTGSYMLHIHMSALLASHRMLRVTRHLATQLQMQNAPVNVHLNNTNKSQPVSARAHACAFSIQPTRIPANRPLPQRPHQAREPRLCSHNSIIPANKVTRLRRGLSLLHRR